MSPPETIRVTGPGNFLGTIDPASWPPDGSRAEVVVRLEGGGTVLVPIDALVRQDDGSYRLVTGSAVSDRRAGVGSSVSEPPLVVPVMEEVVDVRTRPVETGRVRIHKTVREREEVVDPPLLHDEVLIERVPVNRIVEEASPVRSEGDTLIIPVFEEVVVVEKRLLLKEEIHLTTRRVETHAPQRVTLRREEAIVERVDRSGDESHPCT